MIVSTKGRYALRVMIDLAEHPTEGFVPLQEIADRVQISREYLSSILKILVQEGQLTSLRGKGGGYRLALAPEEIRIGAILRMVEGNLAPVSCIQGASQCPDASKCRTHAMWAELDSVISDYLDSVRLTDFLKGGRFYFKTDF